MFRTTLIAAMTFASMQAVELRSETTWKNEALRNHLISLGVDPDTMHYLKLSQTESSDDRRRGGACAEECEDEEEYWSCWSECMGDYGEP